MFATPLTTYEGTYVTTTTELDPFAAAVKAAEVEVAGEPATETPEEPTQPEGETQEDVEDQAAGEGEEQPEVEGPPEDGSDEQSPESPEEEPSSDEDEDELFADLEIEEPTEPPAEPGSEELHELPGIDEPVTTQELRDGFLRHNDYTQKTQELAVQRKQNEQAIGFWETFTSQPQLVAKQLAIEAGWIEPDAEPIKAVELPFRSEEEIQAEVDKRVEEALQNHPTIKDAEIEQGLRWIDSEFERIEGDHEVKLGPESRKKILTRAQKAGTDDLELVFEAMLAEQQRASQKRQALKDSAPGRPQGTPNEESNTEPAGSFEEAVELARAELANRRK